MLSFLNAGVKCDCEAQCEVGRLGDEKHKQHGEMEEVANSSGSFNRTTVCIQSCVDRNADV